MGHARQWFVDFIQIYDGGGVRVGLWEGGGARRGLAVRFRDAGSLCPGAAVLLLELIVFLFWPAALCIRVWSSTEARVLAFTLNPITRSPDSELSLRLLDWHPLRHPAPSACPQLLLFPPLIRLPSSRANSNNAVIVNTFASICSHEKHQPGCGLKKTYQKP